MRKQITLQDFELKGSIGIHDFEKQGPQALVFNVVLTLRDSYKVSADHIGEALDYDFIRPLIIDVVTHDHTHLQETIIQEIVTRTFAHSPLIEAVWAKSSKTSVYDDCKAVSFEIATTRDEWIKWHEQ